MRVLRIVLGVLGVAAIGYGAKMLLNAPTPTVVGLILWLAAAVIIHDGVLSPLVLAVGAALARIPPRIRRPVQAGLIAAACVTVIAVPMIIKQNDFPPSKALLRQDYRFNLGVLLVLIALGIVVLQAIRVARDRPRSGSVTGPGPATTVEDSQQSGQPVEDE